MLDSHCHLTDPRLGAQLEDVLSRARAAGVIRFITIGTGLADDEAAVALCRGRPDVRCAIGVHPNESHEADVADLPRLRDLQRDPAVVALGEMGLDYFHHYAPRAHQFRIFEPQLQLATDLIRPVVHQLRKVLALPPRPIFAVR